MKSQNLLIGFLLLLIIPLGILFLYNHPSADDWWYSEAAKNKGLLEMQKNIYMEWSGRFFLTATASLSPLYFNSIVGYKILALLLMLLFVYSMYLLITEFTKKELLFRERFLLALAIFFMYIYAMPSLIQAFYWLNGSLTYQVPLFLIMLFLVLNAKITESKNNNVKWLLSFLCALMLIAIIGSSEITMVLCDLMIFLLLMYKFISREKISARLILYSVVIAVASLISIIAPGNSVRKSLFAISPLNQNLSFFEALLKTLFLMADYLADWILGTPLLFISLLIIPIIYKIAKNYESKPKIILFQPVYVVMTILVIFFTMFILFFMPLWVQGTEPLYRSVNVIYFIFLSGWFYCLIILMYYLAKKFDFETSKIPKYFYVFAFLILVLYLFKPNNIKTAGIDLISGSAVTYNEKLNERYDLINKSPSDTVMVPAVIQMPRTLFLLDITSNPNDRLNKYYAHYFGKNAIAITDTAQ